MPNPSLIDPLDESQHDDVSREIVEMIKTASYNGFHSDRLLELQALVTDHINIFQKMFSSGPPNTVKPILQEIPPNKQPVYVKIRRYMRDQRIFLLNIMDKPIAAGPMYSLPK